jgi:hypothetical protein
VLTLMSLLVKNQFVVLCKDSEKAQNHELIKLLYHVIVWGNNPL